ncbi:DUF6221 family protein [Streptomyces cadmiisoli]|uniref:DUF6221 family protein n=1 Tax=Streptomyces cadmiisoli TaxID=2184053 RepID=UPI0036481D20
MDELVRWLGKQLDEDERIARAACEGGEGRWQALGNEHGGYVAGDHEGYHVAYDEGYPTLEQATHIAEWDPARVLREIEARRAIVDDLTEEIRWAARMSHDYQDGANACERTLKRLALPYADRSGYREEWRP